MEFNDPISIPDLFTIIKQHGLAMIRFHPAIIQLIGGINLLYLEQDMK
jgi:hypothetical protein